MRTCLLGIALLGISCTFLPTSSAPMASRELQAESRRFDPPPGKALIYVIRVYAFVGADMNVLAEVDDIVLGAMPTRSYAVEPVDPGVHSIEGVFGRRNTSLEIRVKEGEMHFIQVTVGVGGVALSPLPPGEGREYVLKYRMIQPL